MRKIIAFIAALLMVLPLSACGTSAADDHTETYDSVCVDVSAHEDGFYSLMSNVEIHYYDGGMGRTIDELKKICLDADWKAGKMVNNTSERELADWACQISHSKLQEI